MFSREVKKKEIENIEFIIELLPFSEGWQVFDALKNILLPIAASFTEYQNGMTDTWVSEAAANYLVSYNQIDKLSLAKKLLQNCTVIYCGGAGKTGSFKLNFNTPGNEESFDNFFAGKMQLFIKVMAFAIEANFPDFFSEAASLVQEFKLSLKESGEAANKAEELE